MRYKYIDVTINGFTNHGNFIPTTLRRLSVPYLDLMIEYAYSKHKILYKILKKYFNDYIFICLFLFQNRQCVLTVNITVYLMNK